MRSHFLVVTVKMISHFQVTVSITGQRVPPYTLLTSTAINTANVPSKTCMMLLASWINLIMYTSYNGPWFVVIFPIIMKWISTRSMPALQVQQNTLGHLSLNHLSYPAPLKCSTKLLVEKQNTVNAHLYRIQTALLCRR